jgi:VWFA-related protein
LLRVVICAICVICGCSVLTLAQSPTTKEKKIKEFGSSLKRLKWNPEQNAAVDATDGHGTEVNEGDVIRIDTSLVSCELLVLDKSGNAVSGLTAEDFSISEDGKSQKVGHFLKGDNVAVPRSIVLIIDYSGSQLPYLQNSISAAKVLVEKLGPRDQMAIVTDDVELLVDFTSDKKKLNQELESLLERTRPKRNFLGVRGKFRVGRSMQYSALMATLNEAFDNEDVRPIIIFQTDGDEALFLRNTPVKMSFPEGLEGEALERAQQSYQFHQSELKTPAEFSLDDVYRAVERSRATMYTVIPGPKLVGLPIEEQARKIRADRRAANASVLATMSGSAKEKVKARIEHDEKNFTDAYDRWRADLSFKMQSALAGVAIVTGGWTEFLERPEQAHDIYARIFSDINQRYIIGYYPTNKIRDGKRRKIDFEVKGHPDYQIFGRRSYFAPKP